MSKAGAHSHYKDVGPDPRFSDPRCHINFGLKSHQFHNFPKCSCDIRFTCHTYGRKLGVQRSCWYFNFKLRYTVSDWGLLAPTPNPPAPFVTTLLPLGTPAKVRPYLWNHPTYQLNPGLIQMCFPRWIRENCYHSQSFSRYGPFITPPGMYSYHLSYLCNGWVHRQNQELCYEYWNSYLYLYHIFVFILSPITPSHQR